LSALFHPYLCGRNAAEWLITMTDISIKIGEKIKDARKAAHISQTELATRLGKTLRTVQKYESGEILPSIPIIQQIATELGVFPFQLMAYDRPEIQINSLSDVMYIIDQLNKKAGIRFKIDVKHVSRDGEWSCALKFDGHDPDAIYNPTLCLFLERYASERLRLETYWSSPSQFDEWLDSALSHYMDIQLQDRVIENLPLAESIQKRLELDQQQLAQKKQSTKNEGGHKDG